MPPTSGLHTEVCALLRRAHRAMHEGIVLRSTEFPFAAPAAWNSVPKHLLTDGIAHPFNGPLSGITRVSRYQKGKDNVDFTEARDSKWQWHQLGHMQVYTWLQTDNHASTSPLLTDGISRGHFVRELKTVLFAQACLTEEPLCRGSF